MKAKLIHEDGERTFALVFETGDEVGAGLLAFARERSLRASHFSGIGAFSDIILGFFDWERKDYRRIPVAEQVEVLALLGDITLDGGAPKVHAHVVVGKADGTAHGGHLMEAHVRPTLEVILIESPKHLERRVDPESGLPLIAL
jgi:hypothetical protein